MTFPAVSVLYSQSADGVVYLRLPVSCHVRALLLAPDYQNEVLLSFMHEEIRE